MALNEFKLSDLGLLNINRKIIGSRRYDSELIETVGTVNIFESKAWGFNLNSYLYKPDLSFTKSSITIACSCNFTTSDTDQVAYLIKGENHSISLHFNNEQARLLINDRVVIQYSYLNLKDNTEIRTIVKLTQETCNFTMYAIDTVFEKSVTLTSPVNITDLTNLYIGNEPEMLGNFWMGSIDLSTFTISEDNVLVYSPSASYPLVFSKILISDGEFNLNDKSIPIANHIYEYKVSEITRSGGTVLLTALIDDDAKLTIKEIGLYATTADGEILFSSVSGLSINKGDGVPYDLIFTMNLYTSFINVTGFPDYNSIVINEPEPCLFQDFTSVKDVIIYTFTNLERIIKMNALDIGYNRAQVFYRFQKEISGNEECYYTIENFFKISKKLKRIVEILFDPAVVTIHGNLNVPDNGIIKEFTNSDYISSNILFDNSKNWEVDFAFKSEKKTGTLFTLRGPSPIQPLIIQTNYSSEEDKLYLYAKLGKNGTNDEFIIDANIYELEEDIQYFMKFKYVHTDNEEDSYYQLLVSDDNEDYEEAFTKYSPRIILPVRGVSLGVLSSYNVATRDFTTSDPFRGTFYTNSFKIQSNSEIWTPTIENVIQPAQLTQYYHIPDLYKSRYVLQDLCNPNEYLLTVLETLISTNNDLMDFSNSEGFSLCMNVELKNNKPKIVLAKTNLVDRPYFLFALLNQTIYFYLFTKLKTIILSKVIEDSELVSYLNGVNLFTVTISKSKVILYRGTEVIATFQGFLGTFKNYKYCSLKNYIQTSMLRNICGNLDLRDVPLDDYVQEVENNQGRYIRDILAVQGCMTPEDVYYVNILMSN